MRSSSQPTTLAAPSTALVLRPSASVAGAPFGRSCRSFPLSVPWLGGAASQRLRAVAGSRGRPRRVEVLPEAVEVVRRVARREALEMLS